jgi:ParB-like chromosome segregation protein Spo0J
MTYELHPLCTLFPRMQGAEFDALCEDIKAHGLRQPIVLHGGMILDGGNRYRACVEAGVTPLFEDFKGDSLVAYVLSANLHRRHMTTGQHAAIVSAAQDWAKAQQVGRPGNGQAVDHFSTVAQRAAASGASRVTQMKADKVAKADPALAVKVAHGEVSLPKAHAAVSKPAPAKPKRELPAAPDAAQYEVDDLRASVQALVEQNDHLESRLAVEAMDATEDEKTMAAGMIAELKSQVKALEAEVDALRSMRNSLLVENRELKSSVAYWRRHAEKAGV